MDQIEKSYPVNIKLIRILEHQKNSIQLLDF